jgi:endonuclease-3
VTGGARGSTAAAARAGWRWSPGPPHGARAGRRPPRRALRAGLHHPARARRRHGAVAQCTDKRVNEVTPALFRRYRPRADYAGADRHRARGARPPHRLLPQQGQQPHRARSGAGRAGTTGRCPGRLEDLVQLPGVGRKTANVVLGNASASRGSPSTPTSAAWCAGSAGTELDDPVKVEAVVAELLPRADWTMFSPPRDLPRPRVCHARKPACGAVRIARSAPPTGGPTDPTSPRPGQDAEVASRERPPARASGDDRARRAAAALLAVLPCWRPRRSPAGRPPPPRRPGGETRSCRAGAAASTRAPRGWARCPTWCCRCLRRPGVALSPRAARRAHPV